MSGSQQMHLRYQGIQMLDFPALGLRQVLNCLLQAVACYPWRVRQIRWVQDGVYQVWAAEGVFCLKQSNRPLPRTKFALAAMEVAFTQGFQWQPRLLAAKNGRPLVVLPAFAAEAEAQYWYAVSWLVGQRSVFAVPAHLTSCVQALARFHQAAVGMRADGGAVQYQLWPELLTERTYQLEAWRQQLQTSSQTGSPALQQCFLKEYPAALERGRQAAAWLQGGEYQALAAASQEAGCFIHGDTAARNFIVRGGTAFLIDFDLARYDLQVLDLARLLERALRMSNYRPACWRQALVAYEEIRPLSKPEKRVLAALLHFPQRFWQLGRRWQEQRLAEEGVLRRFEHLAKNSRQEQQVLQELEQYLLS